MEYSIEYDANTGVFTIAVTGPLTGGQMIRTHCCGLRELLPKNMNVPVFCSTWEKQESRVALWQRSIRPLNQRNMDSAGAIVSQQCT
jgi:hypothetical protein